MALRLFVCFAMVAAVLSNVDAFTREVVSTIREPLESFVNACSAEYNISADQLRTAKETKSVEGIEPCAIGCVYKKAKFINEEGNFDTEKVKELGEKFVSNPEDRQRIAEIARQCSAVNEIAVSDGNQGCERAVLLLACMAKHRAAVRVFFSIDDVTQNHK